MMTDPKIQSKIDGIALIGMALTIGKDLAFFTKPGQAKKAFKLFSKEIRRSFPVPAEPALIVDLAAVLFLIENETFDDSAVILNCLNTIFDLLPSAGKKLSEERKNLLWKFADHLTFEKEFGQYLAANSISRESIIDALTWCVGAIVTKSKILFT